MDKSLQNGILGIFFTILAVYTFVSNARANDIYENWIECEAQVTDVFVTTDSDSPAADTRSWHCTLEYTREDGTSHVLKGVTLSHEVGYGSVVPIMYDPDSDKAVPHARGENTDRVGRLIFGWCATIAAAALYLSVAVDVLRDKRKAAQSKQ